MSHTHHDISILPRNVYALFHNKEFRDASSTSNIVAVVGWTWHFPSVVEISSVIILGE
jgi:hypothetical protein